MHRGTPQKFVSRLHGNKREKLRQDRFVYRYSPRNKTAEVCSEFEIKTLYASDEGMRGDQKRQVIIITCKEDE